jgi:Asp-tRNA(Asn)/Glu-tRNA(Gln) amidotransferase A subunit family amidase
MSGVDGAGAVLLGKTNVPLGLGDLQSFNDIYGVTRNPSDVGRTPGGLVAAPDLAIVGPMARSADDLQLTMDVLAGPEPLDALGWRLELPPAKTRGLRVALWPTDPYCQVATAVADRVVRVGAVSAGGAIASHREWLYCHNQRERLRYPCRAFFDEWHVLLCPQSATPAFPHDHGPTTIATSR